MRKRLPAEKEAGMRIRALRYSLVNVVGLITIVALTLGLIRNGREVVPLRNELAWFQNKFGFFATPDKSRIYTRRSRMKAPGNWQWRFHLPESRAYRLQMFVGQATDPPRDSGSWIAQLRTSSTTVARELPAGLFAYEVCLVEFDGRWWLRAGEIFQDDVTLQLPEGCDWLANAGSRKNWSDASYDEVREFAANEPLVLLNVEREEAPDADADGEMAGSDGVRDRIVLWIE
jgi:hypothetical protein